MSSRFPFRRESRRGRQGSGKDDEDEGERGERYDDEEEDGEHSLFPRGGRARTFEDFDQLIEKMYRSLEDFRGPQSGTFTGSPPNTIFYGYSVGVGRTGKPQVREFGNVRPSRNGRMEISPREPFIETMVDEKENLLKVVAEMPGLEKEDINVETTDDSVIIRASRGDRNYDSTVPLELKVQPDTAKASYNNGILEIRLKLKELVPPQKPKGINVKIE